MTNPARTHAPAELQSWVWCGDLGSGPLLSLPKYQYYFQRLLLDSCLPPSDRHPKPPALSCSPTAAVFSSFNLTLALYVYLLHHYTTSTTYDTCSGESWNHCCCTLVRVYVRALFCSATSALTDNHVVGIYDGIYYNWCDPPRFLEYSVLHTTKYIVCHVSMFPARMICLLIRVCDPNLSRLFSVMDSDSVFVTRT